MTISKVSDLNSLFNLIYEDSVFVAREQSVMAPLVHQYQGRGYMARVIPKRPLITAQTKPEGVDFANATLWDKQEKNRLTPAVAMAQSILTDEQNETDPEDARQQCSTELGNSIATKIDVDLCGDFASFTTGKGSAGGTASIAYYAAAVSVLRNAKAMSPIRIVLHPYHWHRVWTELGKPTANQAFLGDIANQALKSFFVGAFLAADWFTDANIAVDSSDDAVSGVFNGEALALDTRQAPTLEPERDASKKAWELNESAAYGHGLGPRSEWGVKVTADASEPA